MFGAMAFRIATRTRITFWGCWPALFGALRRLASIFSRELFENQAEQLGSFVRPAKAGVFSRDQTCRGKSQKPRSLDGRVEGNRDSEAHRQGLLMGDHESPGRNESVNAKWPRNHRNPRANCPYMAPISAWRSNPKINLIR
jgi:hypothetical protein